MVTIREALDLPSLSTSKLVAGKSGVDNFIEWVHIVDIKGATFAYDHKGILLLTTGNGLVDEPESQQELIPKLVQEEYAGLIWGIGHVFDKIPENVISQANALNFPVIEAPKDLLFVKVSTEILDKIAKRQYRLLTRSNQIHRQLTDLVLRGGSLQDLAERLATSIKRSISIEDASFRVLASHDVGPIDDARRLSVENGRTPSKMAQRLLDLGIYDQLLHKMGPLQVKPIPELEMVMERVVAPIIVDRKIYGYMWIISGDRPFTDLDELAMDQAATVAALLLFKNMAVKEAMESLQGDFFEELLRGTIHTVSFSEQAHKLGFQVEKKHQIILVEGTPQAGGGSRSLYENIQNWLEKINVSPLLVSRDQRIVIILQSGDEASGKQISEGLIKDISHPACPLRLGVGLPFALSESSDGMKISYEQALEALRIGQTLHKHEGYLMFGELGLYHWLYNLNDDVRIGNRYLDKIRELSVYDNNRNTELVKTLESYLDHGGSLVDTAQSLYIHRNTLLHRLERIKQLNQIDLRNPLQRLNLHIAVKAYRLHD